MRLANRSLSFVAALSLLLLPTAAKSDDSIFPAAEAAKSAIAMDGRGFSVHGERTVFASGSIHYTRVPRGLWRDRLLRLKRAGFNTVETYAFWNAHEAKEGVFDFSGQNDLGAFLTTAESVGLYVIVRVGPYICGEWDSGGFPVWLRFKSGLRVREENAPYEAAVARWFEHLFPIITAHQIHKGGSIVLVQLENEHPLGWGAEAANGYFTRLRDKALRLGLEVPHFFSGLNHGHEPMAKPVDGAKRTVPWMTTEFWPGWFDLYGPLSEQDLTTYNRNLWRILAYGGNGWNFYMFHGGSNFGFDNDNDLGASYDYASPVGEAGDLRPSYYRFKRAAQLATSFPEIFANSENADTEFASIAGDKSLKAHARRGADGAFVFLENEGSTPITTALREGGTITVRPHELVATVKDLRLTPEISLDWSTIAILGRLQQGTVTSIIMYGRSGDKVDGRFRAKSAPANAKAFGQGNVVVNGSAVQVQTTITDGPPQRFEIEAGSGTLRILVMSDTLADKTFFVATPPPSQDLIVYGYDFVGEAAWNGKTLQLKTESMLPTSGAHKDVGAWGERGPLSVTVTESESHGAVTLPTTGWRFQKPHPLAQGRWLASAQPLAMGADGDTSAFAWYRAQIASSQTQTVSLVLQSVRDYAQAFVDGKPVGSTSMLQRVAPVTRVIDLPLHQGRNNLSLFTSHAGRNKLFSYLGAIDSIDAKGLTGKAWLRQSARAEATPISRWQIRPTRSQAPSAADLAEVVAGTGAAWTESEMSPEIFRRKASTYWFRAVLDGVTFASATTRRLLLPSLHQSTQVFLNGHKIGQQQRLGLTPDLSLDAHWLPNGPNVLAVKTDTIIEVAFTPQLLSVDMGKAIPGLAGEEGEITGWQMQGGVAPAKSSDWKPCAGRQPSTHVPTFYATTFTVPKLAKNDAGVIYRVSVKGLSRGSVWLNGHNLGRYPLKLKVDGLYLPEPWLRSGSNELVLLDEEGQPPREVSIKREDAASRIVQTLGINP